GAGNRLISALRRRPAALSSGSSARQPARIAEPVESNSRSAGDAFTCSMSRSYPAARSLGFAEAIKSPAPPSPADCFLACAISTAKSTLHQEGVAPEERRIGA